ncbi:hypothetical protein DM01DRAFT_1335749 [Hesseltinella vesiculosa]|uniref:Uncharacterized protein n=1 Tax=Hesseltinella vesiculosa TaxID=101127 RepID=A0A1X2GIM8_9FUNG|nr:hypothetical protein DM01DRAFT_1335749 [Hesseltinella vesiculosa]
MKRRRVTLSLKNTVLWNPSTDLDNGLYAFKPEALGFLKALVQHHEVYLVIQVNNNEEQQQIQHLLQQNHLQGFDERKILFCQKEQGKIHLVRHLEAQIHIEGGWEQDDGEEIVRQLKPFVPKIIWVQKHQRQVALGASVESVQNVTDTSFSKDLLSQ